MPHLPSPLNRRAAASGLALIAGLLALHCGKGGYEEHAPKVSHLVAYGRDGGVGLVWNESKQALVEQAAPATPPVYNYETNQWTVGGQPGSGPSVSLNDAIVAGRMRPQALGLGAGKKLLGMACVGARSEICFAAVCTVDGDKLKGYDLRVCDEKDRTTAGCKTYKVEGGVSTHCPVYFYGAIS